MRPLLVPSLAVALLAAACSGGGGVGDDGAPAADPFEFPAAPAVPEGELTPGVAEAAEALMVMAGRGLISEADLVVVAGSGDARLAWYLSDLLRFFPEEGEGAGLVDAFIDLTGVDPAGDRAFAESAWRSVTDHLLAWDLPAPPDYRERKATLFTAVEPGWEPFFADDDSLIDWRHLSWGGVLIDDRPAGDDEPCPRGCIPALDDPAFTSAEEGSWFGDDQVVFGLTVGDDTVALPRNIMEVHEMVNVTLGGRRLGIPYCTLCLSAQAYVTEGVGGGPAGEPLVLRTSGLLSQSNKVMYDLATKSVFDTFTGQALSGPLLDAEVVLEQLPVVVSTWGAWKAEHPDTRIVAEDGGIGVSYPDDPLGGRDDDGPIFPIGDADDRLPVQERIVGAVTAAGTAVAVPVAPARDVLQAGAEVEVGGVTAAIEGDGLRLFTDGGDPLASHQSFWFAWSQFHPDTLLWEAPQG